MQLRHTEPVQTNPVLHEKQAKAPDVVHVAQSANSAEHARQTALPFEFG
jgi:hypothetical protein